LAAGQIAECKNRKKIMCSDRIARWLNPGRNLRGIDRIFRGDRFSSRNVKGLSCFPRSYENVARVAFPDDRKRFLQSEPQMF
jgi:hypothetical protein